MDRDQTHEKEKLICIQRQSVVFFWGSIFIFLGWSTIRREICPWT